MKYLSLFFLLLSMSSLISGPIEIQPIEPINSSTSTPMTRKVYRIEGAQVAAFGKIFGISDPSKIVGGQISFSGAGDPALILTVTTR